MLHRMKAAAWGAILFVVMSIALPRPAQADPSAPEKAAAETLFADARKLLAAGKYAEACKSFAESQRLDPGVGTLLNLSVCYEKLGRTASAWLTYREAAAAARSANQGAREKNARHAADALEPKLPKLTIVVTNAETNPRLEVRRDGAVMPSSMWGMSVAVDPGEHLIEASSPGYKPWRSRLVAEASKTVTVNVPALEPDGKAVQAATLPAKSIANDSAPVPAQRTPEPPPTSSGLGGQRVAALVVGGAGVVSLGVAGFFAGRAQATYKAADCDENDSCSYQGLVDRNLAFARARTATFATAGGLVALAAGVVLWVTAPSAPSTDAAGDAPPRSRLWVSADPLGEGGARSLTVGGVF